MSLDFFELIGVTKGLQSIIFGVTNVIDGIQGLVRLSTSPTPPLPSGLDQLSRGALGGSSVD